METPKRSVFHRIGRRTSVFDRIHFSCGESSRNRKVSVFDRLGIPAEHRADVGVRVCKFWVQGRCTRNPCKFRHSNPPNSNLDEDELKPAAISKKRESDGGPKRKRPCTYDDVYDDDLKEVAEPELKRLNRGKQGPGCDYAVEPLNLDNQKQLTEIAKPTTEVGKPGAEEVKTEATEVVAEVAVKSASEEEEDLQCTGSGLSLLCQLKRHNGAVTGVCLPPGSDKLYSVSKEGTLCTWDCTSGDCAQSFQLANEIGCLVIQDEWLFVGLDNCVKAYQQNTTNALVLGGFEGPVRSMAAGDTDKLIAGLQDGSICVWRYSTMVATLKGHKLPVLALCIPAAGCLYSASEDHTIRVWDLNTFECLSVLDAHSGPVTSLISWGTHLLSGSLDNTIKVWLSSEYGGWKVVHDVGTEFGVIGLSCKYDVGTTLLCSLNNNSVCFYSLPSFSERGRISSKAAVTSTSIGGTDLFFTGDASGLIGVWRLGPEKL